MSFDKRKCFVWKSAIKDVEERVANAKKLGGVDNINFEGNELRKSFGQAIEGIISSMTREMDDLTKGCGARGKDLVA